MDREFRPSRADRLRRLVASEAEAIGVVELARRIGVRARTLRGFLRGRTPLGPTLDTIEDHFNPQRSRADGLPECERKEAVRERRARWRSSPVAKRLGTLACDLEALVCRDGYRLAEAGEVLRTSGRTLLSDAELARLLANLPSATRGAMVSEPAEFTAGRPDERIAAAESEERRARVMGALERALERVDPEERQIARMHFTDGCTLADIARALRLEQKTLYRRLDRLRARLRAYLEDDGVNLAQVREIMDEAERF